jgi:hypothetical protein
MGFRMEFRLQAEHLRFLFVQMGFRLELRMEFRLKIPS